MIGILSVVAGQLRRLRPKPDIAVELCDLDEMEQEVNAMLRSDTSWVSNSSLTKLFFADIERARELLEDGKKSLAKRHISDASATRHCIRLNIRSESGDTVFN